LDRSNVGGGRRGGRELSVKVSPFCWPVMVPVKVGFAGAIERLALLAETVRVWVVTVRGEVAVASL